MHVRETIESQAEIEGKTADELWDEAAGEVSSLLGRGAAR